MTRITLYTGAGVSLSPTYAEGRIVSSYIRLVADGDKALQKGEIVCSCVDVLAADANEWTEIDAPIDEDEISDEEAFNILMGVSE